LPRNPRILAFAVSATSWWRAIPAAGALAVLAGGCEGTTMSAEGARVPVLVGPVACIGCAPAPTPVWRGPPLEEEVYYHYLLTGGAGGSFRSREWKKPSLAHNASRVVTNPCLADMHVGKIAASAFGVAGLIIWTQRVSIEVEATPARVPHGWCGDDGPPQRPAPQPAPERDPDDDAEEDAR
jgi:hypothetical protein